jgi:hypothetical protein
MEAGAFQAAMSTFAPGDVVILWDTPVVANVVTQRSVSRQLSLDPRAGQLHGR